ncbi:MULTISPECIES: helix-turn-helix transcriptional regulator [Streptomyces]|uniref:helix-turn-helix domain-containing protein n=1 Tax=Streptomyces TaxID=1883 RepID=UPI0006896AF9|nr:helix-turn-helix transcriptional regulator [Streptomyces sp. CNQ431]UYM23815.1 helix-turn-helix transcriptional regulator [Streptomyces albus]
MREGGLAELAARVGVTNVNLSVLKNGRAKAIRFTTLTAICRVLECQPGDLLSYEEEGWGEGGSDAEERSGNE